MALFQWDPWWDLQGRYSDLVDLLRGASPLQRYRLGNTPYPPMNIRSTNDNVFVSLEVPGVRRDQLDLSITGDTLTIKGSKSLGEDEDYERHERYAGDFTRVIQVPGDVVQEEIKAALSDGVLTITLTKAPRARKRQIAVEPTSGK